MYTTLVALGAVLLTGCGPGYLTPEQAREHLENPKGQVTRDTIGRATDDFFLAQRGSAAESTASFIKANESSGDGAAAWASGVVAQGSMEQAVALGAAEDIGDIFCAASLVASIANFDACSESADSCEAELVIDSCILRIGDGGDRQARGKIKYTIKTRSEADFERSELRITFDNFQYTDDEGANILAYFAGILAIETTEWSDGRDEVIFSCDLDEQRRGPERGLFNDDIVERTRVTVAMRFLHEESATSETGSLQILAFVDESEDARDESVVISFQAESREIDDSTTLAGATLSVRGSNGSFECVWGAASEDIEGERRTYQSEGRCIDSDSGEEFNWSSTTTYGDS